MELERPALCWSGSGYFDINDGDEPLEDGFSHWDWARASLGGGKGAALLYDVVDRQGQHRSIALAADEQWPRLVEVEPPAPVRLPRTLWRMPRGTRADGARVASSRRWKTRRSMPARCCLPACSAEETRRHA